MGGMVCLAVLLVGSGVFAKESGALDFRKGFSGVASKATPAVVFIQVEKQVPAGNMY